MRLRRLLPILALFSLLALTGGTPTSATTADSQVPPMNHVFLIIGENTQLSQLNTGNAPYLLNTLKPDSAWLTDYFATTHYSESNYVAMTSGQFSQCEQKDGKATACHQNVDNLFQQLAVGQRSFTTWSESMPAPCYLLNTGSDSGLNHYAAKHNPQLFFDNVEGNSLGGGWLDVNTQGGTFCQSTNIAMGGTGPNDTSTFEDALAGKAGAPAISDFNLVVPNECEDGHSNCKPAGNPIGQFDAFLSREVPLIQSYISAHGGLLIVTFDEGVTSSPKRAVKFGDGGNVAFDVWGPQVHNAVYTDGLYTHYSLLRTLEDGFGIGTYLGGANDSQPIARIWK